LAAFPLVAHAEWPVEGLPVGGNWPGAVLLGHPPSDILVVYRVHGSLSYRDMARTISRAGTLGPAGELRSEPRRVVPDGAGGYFELLSDPDVLARHFLKDGTLVPGPSTWWPVATTSARERAAGGAADGSGALYVAWAKDARDLYLQRLEADGAPAPGWPIMGLLVATAPGAVLPIDAPLAVALDGSGGAYVMWHSADESARAQRITAAGATAPGWPAGGITLGSVIPSTDVQRVALLPSGNDHWLAVWLQPDYDNRLRLKLQRFASDGTLDPVWPPDGLLGLETQPSSPPPNAATFQLVSDGQGGVTFAESQPPSGDPRFFHVLSNGAFGPPGGVVPQDRGEIASAPIYLATGNEGGVIVGWDDRRPASPGVRVLWLSADGTLDPTEPDTGWVASPLDNRIHVSSLMSDGDGGAYALWDRYYPPPLDFHVAYASYHARSAAVSAPLVSTPGPSEVVVTPNPARDALTVRFSLAGVGPVSLELFDLAGRRLRSAAVSGRAGPRAERIEGLGRLRPGVYLVRLLADGSSRWTRVAIVH
jgi:hypothetical protein